MPSVDGEGSMVSLLMIHLRITILGTQYSWGLQWPNNTLPPLSTGEVSNLIMCVWFKQIKVQPFIYMQSICMGLHVPN